jgi:hypothetical protein
VTKKQTQDRKAASAKDKAPAKSDKKASAKAPAKDAGKPKPTDLKSILKAMVKPLPPPKPKPPKAVPPASDSKSTTEAKESSKEMSKVTGTAAPKAQQKTSAASNGKQPAAKAAKPGEAQTTEERPDSILDLTDRAHRRSGAHVPARNGHGGTAVARGRNRHRQAHRGRPRGDDRGLCESPLTFQAIIIWRDELNEGKILLRDIIDLEATYAGPDAKQAAEGGIVIPPEFRR